MFTIDNRKTALTPAMYDDLGKATGYVQVFIADILWVALKDADYYKQEEGLRVRGRREAKRFDAYLMFEKGRVKL
jgi:hypothetical protein